MGFEITVHYHPRKSEGVGFDTDVVKKEQKSVGKPFDDTTLDQLAGVVIGQLARRDVMVVDLEIDELTRRKVSFKEATDGRGIVLKNKKFSIDATAKMVSEDVVEISSQPIPSAVQAPVPVRSQPLQGVTTVPLQRGVTNIDSLYNADAAVPVQIIKPDLGSIGPIDQTKVLYTVIYEPGHAYINQARALKLKFTDGNRYKVHHVIESPSGRLDARKIAVTDDSGKVVSVDEKFFSSAGPGLKFDNEVDFSDRRNRSQKTAKLLYDDAPSTGQRIQDIRGVAGYEDAPVDNGEIPAEYMVMPNLRPGRPLQ